MVETRLLITTHGRTDLLGRTLASLAECAFPPGFSGVTVIENGSQRGTESICRGVYGDLRVEFLRSDVTNKSLALNLVMQQISDETLVIFSDDDIRFTPGLLHAYYQAASTTPPGRFFGGPFGCDYEVEPPEWMKPYLPLSAVGWTSDPRTFDPRSNRFYGCNWAAFSGDIKRLGGFDPNFGPGSPTGATGQESNMQRRMFFSGMQSCYVPQAMVYLFVPQNRCSTDWTVQRARRNGMSRGVALRNYSVPRIALQHWSNSFRLLTSTAVKWVSSPVPSSRLHFHARCDQQKALGYFSGFRGESTDTQRRAA